MAKNNDVVPSDGSNGGIFSSFKGILLICGIAWAAISGTYAAGYKASDRTRIEVNKERKRHEKEKRRESKERRKERKRRQKLELWKAKRGLTK
jgi:hypothetical protein